MTPVPRASSPAPTKCGRRSFPEGLGGEVTPLPPPHRASEILPYFNNKAKIVPVCALIGRGPEPKEASPHSLPAQRKGEASRGEGGKSRQRPLGQERPVGLKQKQRRSLLCKTPLSPVNIFLSVLEFSADSENICFQKPTESDNICPRIPPFSFTPFGREETKRL